MINDSYALIALGNIWLQTLHQPSKSKNEEIKHQRLAMEFFCRVLDYDSKNIWASNGIGKC